MKKYVYIIRFKYVGGAEDTHAKLSFATHTA